MVRFTIKMCSFLLLLCCTINLQSQSDLMVANKQYDLKAYNLAINSYKNYLAKDPNNTEAIGKLADSYRQTNDLLEASKWYEKIIDRPGLDKNVIKDYAMTLKALRLYGKAKFYFNEYAKHDPVLGNHYAASCDFAREAMKNDPSYKISSFPMNTSYSDFGPAFFKSNIIFSSSRQDITRKSNNGSKTTDSNNQLFQTTQSEMAQFARPRFLRDDMDEIYNLGPVSFAPMAGMIAYTKNNFYDGGKQIDPSNKSLSIYIATLDSKGNWESDIAFPYNGNAYSTAFPHLTEDGKSLYFASNRPDGQGGYDLYVSRLQGNKWTFPENLGSEINSPGNEISPFVNGSELYFSSDYHAGIGGLDVFKAKLFSNKWREITNLGNGINSPRDDYGYVYNNSMRKALFTSNRIGGKGFEDIYIAEKTSDEISILVLDAKSRVALEGAMIDLGDCGKGAMTANANGKVFVNTSKKLNCSIKVSKQGYAMSSIKIDQLSGMSYKSIEVLLKPYEGTVTSAKPSTTTSRPTTTTTSRPTSTTRTSGTYTKPSTSSPSTANTTRTSGTYTKPSTTAMPSSTTTRTSGTYTKPATSTTSTSTTSGTYTKPSTSTASTTTRKTTTDRYSEVTENGTPLRRPVSKTSTPARTYSTSNNDNYSSTTATTTSRPASSTTYSSSSSNNSTSYTSPVAKTTSTSTTKPSTIGGKKMAFAVQVAAYGKTKSGLSAYSKLKSMGTVYEYDSGRLYKVRVGYFADRNAAETALSQIKRKGYKDAFIVSEAVAASSTFVTPSTSSTSYTKPVETKTYTKPAQTKTYTQPSTTSTSSYSQPATTSNTSTYETPSTEVYGNYKVRLAAYSDAKNFDDSQVRNLGTIEHWRKKGWTIVVLSGFESLSSAQAAKSKVASYGFKDAYIVIDDNGVLKKVK